MSKLHIKKGDTVYVNSGEDKGKTGRVLKVLVKEGRALVEGINMVSKSTKPNAKNPQGGIVKQEAAIHISNLNLVDPKTGRVLKVLVKEGRALVEGINMVSKSTKPNAKNPQGGIVKQEAAIHISNLNLVDPKTGKPTRVGRRESSDGRTFVRYAKKSGEEIK